MCVMEERRSELGAAHLTPLSQKAAQRGSLHYVKGGEQVGLWNTQSLPTQPVINSPAGLLESTVKCSSDSGVPWHDEKFHSTQ